MKKMTEMEIRRLGGRIESRDLPGLTAGPASVGTVLLQTSGVSAVAAASNNFVGVEGPEPSP